MIYINLTITQIEAVAYQLKQQGFLFDEFHTDNETYLKIVQAVFDGLEIDIDEALNLAD